jgi:hypothetical protein
VWSYSWCFFWYFFYGVGGFITSDKLTQSEAAHPVKLFFEINKDRENLFFLADLLKRTVRTARRIRSQARTAQPMQADCTHAPRLILTPYANATTPPASQAATH